MDLKTSMARHANVQAALNGVHSLILNGTRTIRGKIYLDGGLDTRPEKNYDDKF